MHPRWRALLAAQLGYLLDAFDVVIYLFAISTFRRVFTLSNAQAGLAGSLTLFASAIGGIVFGYLADRFGRKRALVSTILIYSLASGGTALAHSFPSLLCWRALAGIGLGGEWAAGAVLVAETWPVESRSRAIAFMQSGWALGYILAALASAFVLPRWGWRTLFLLGVAPAALALAIQRFVDEPRQWETRIANLTTPSIFRAPLLNRTLIASALMSTVLCGYWGLFTWLPSFLAAPVVEGGAGIAFVRAAVFLIPTQVGAFLGYLTFGFVCDSFGRRRTFITYVLTAALLTVVYGSVRQPNLLLVLGPFIGFFGSGFFSLFGSLLGELYPTACRATGQGTTYNIGRGVSAGAPYLIGWVADRHGLGSALLVNAGFFSLGAILIFGLPWHALEASRSSVSIEDPS